MVYAGKRVSVERFPGAGLLGRQMAAVGTSVVRNAAEGRSSFEVIALPVGPVRLYVGSDTLPKLRAKVDLLGLATTIYAALDPAAEWDSGASLSAGAPVFRIRRWTEGERTVAQHFAGVVWLRDDHRDLINAEARASAFFAHERVHVLQYDFAFSAWSAPAEAVLLRRVVGSNEIARHVDLGLNALLFGALGSVVSYSSRPWEWEADAFTHAKNK
jgi:hypothetical protein